MEFVSFELAKKLKEERFDCPCRAYYYKWGRSHISDELFTFNSKSTAISAPFAHQVLSWLREEKNIDIDITVHPSFATTTKKVYAWRVVMDSDGMECKYKDGIHTYGKYEQAALAGIEYTLDHLL